MDRRDEQNKVEPAPSQGRPSSVSELRARLAQVEAAMDGVDRGLNAKSDEARRAQVSRAISQNELQAQDAQDRRDRRGSRAVVLVGLLVLISLVLFVRQSRVDDAHGPSESMVPSEVALTPTATASGPPLHDTGVERMTPSSPGVVASKPLAISAQAIPSETLKQALMTLRSDLDAASRVRQPPLALSRGLLPLLQRGVSDATGGVYLGQGGLEHHIVAAQRQPMVLVLFSPTQSLRRLHRAMGVALAASGTADELLRLWSSEGRTGLREVLVDALGDSLEASDVLTAVDAHPNVGRWLIQLAATHRELGVRSLFTDVDQFTYISRLWRQGHAIALVSSVDGSITMGDLATFSGVLKVPLTTLALSHTPQPIVSERELFSEALATRQSPQEATAIWATTTADGQLQTITQSLSAFAVCMEIAQVQGWTRVLERAIQEPVFGGAMRLRCQK